MIVPTTLAPTTTTANPSPTPDPRLTWYLMNNYYGRQSDDDMNCVFSVYKASSDVNRFRIDFLDLEVSILSIMLSTHGFARIEILCI